MPSKHKKGPSTIDTVKSAFKKFGVQKSPGLDAKPSPAKNAFAALEEDSPKLDRSRPPTPIRSVTYNLEQRAGLKDPETSKFKWEDDELPPQHIPYRTQATENSDTSGSLETDTSSEEWAKVANRRKSKRNSMPLNALERVQNVDRTSKRLSAVNLNVDVRAMDNWRTGRQYDNVAKFGATNSGLNNREKRRSGYGMVNAYAKRNALADVRPGTIMWREDVRECTDSRVDTNDDRISTDKSGVHWMRKGRYWIVLTVTRDRILELPIYTYNDTGLVNRSDLEKEEYNSLRPPWDMEGWFNQSPHQAVLDIADITNGRDNFRSTMVVRVTEITHRTHLVESRVLGELTQEATAILIARAKDMIGIML